MTPAAIRRLSAEELQSAITARAAQLAGPWDEHFSRIPAPDRIPDVRAMTRPLAFYVEAYWAAVELSDLLGEALSPARWTGEAVPPGPRFFRVDTVAPPEESWADLARPPLDATKRRNVLWRGSSKAYGIRVLCTWAIGAKGPEGVPFALELLRSSDSERREDATSVFLGIGKAHGVANALVERLRSETDTQARDGIIVALGRIRAREAIPALAAVLRDPAADGDTRSSVVDSLGQIARKRFAKRPDPEGEALRWADGQAEA